MASRFGGGGLGFPLSANNGSKVHVGRCAEGLEV